MQDQPVEQPAPAPQAVVRVEAGPGNAAQTLAMPMTRAEVAAIRARRSELSSQLISASNRRKELAEQAVNTASGPVRAGLEQRIAVLDQRIVQLESDIAETGRQLTGAPAGFLTSTRADGVFGGFSSGEVLAGGIVFTIFVLAPLAVGASRMMWKYAAAAPARSVIPPETAGRLERIEQAVEAIAIEVERVSEGQRFVTKLMSEVKPVPALDSARMQPTTHTSRES
ncbi:MAG TPA: hypothetical protein VMM17_01995 [Gemmatimonadaceae bacterium]|nr:hypothetical protein [Gemmatimonadaceae bacterium]